MLSVACVHSFLCVRHSLRVCNPILINPTSSFSESIAFTGIWLYVGYVIEGGLLLLGLNPKSFIRLHTGFFPEGGEGIPGSHSLDSNT